MSTLTKLNELIKEYNKISSKGFHPSQKLLKDRDYAIGSILYNYEDNKFYVKVSADMWVTSPAHE
jgi:hypothetical protein